MKKIVILICFLLLITGCKEEKKENNINKSNESTITINKVTCDKMKELVGDGALLIDAREIDEYNEGHLDKAINISYTVIKNEISKYATDKNTKIVVYCKSGARSNKAANYLKELGYTNIYDLGSINNCKDN
jgi:rhodanese-related sulfurtransferase